VGEVGPDGGDAAVQVGQGAGVVDHQVGHGQALLPAGLRRYAGSRLLGRHAALADQPLELDLRWHIHHDDQAEVAGPPVFGQQRHVVHDDEVAAGRVHGGLLGGPHPLSDQGVDDGVQRGARGGIGEHDRAEPVPVQGAVRAEHPGAEGLGHSREPGGSRGDHRPGGEVRVDDHGPVRGQPPGHLTLAGPDAPGQPGPQQPATLSRHGYQRRGVRWSSWLSAGFGAMITSSLS